MRSTGEVANLYTLYRTYVMTRTASCAFVVIYGCKIVYYLDCSLGAGLLTLAAGYASVGAYLADLSALVVTVALNCNL